MVRYVASLAGSMPLSALVILTKTFQGEPDKSFAEVGHATPPMSKKKIQ
jgi:hypothetical protein